jgi:glycosyltransferase involved in cell wall biosynthesis
MRILYLSQYFSPEFGAAAARARSMTRWLARFGHEMTVITALPNYLMVEMPEPYRGKRWVQEEIEGVQVYRAGLYTSPKRNTWRRMANYLSFMASSWWHGRKLSGPFDVVITSSPPLFLGLSGVALARRFHAPLVFDVRDMWPEVGVRLDALRPDSLTLQVWEKMADYIYDHSAAIVSVTQGMREDMILRGLPAQKLYLIPNGVDLAFVQEEAPDLREELALENKCVVLYAGLLGAIHGPEIIAEAATILQKRRDIHFLVVGDGVRREAIAKRVHELGLDNVTMLPMQPQDRVPRFLKTADICLATLANSAVKGVVHYKMLEAWAYRRPVIITDEDEGGNLARSCNAGLATPPGDACALADAILRLEADRALAKRMGENGRHCIEERLNREALARKLEETLKTIVEHSHDEQRGLKSG